MSWGRLLLIAAALAALGWGANALVSHFIGIGDQRGASRVQAAWNEQKAVDQQKTLELERERSAEQLLKFRNAERIADEQAHRDAVRDGRIAAGNAVADSLRSTIERLDRRDLSEAGGDSRSIALAQSAATARELFGSCNQAQLDLAAEADRLRDQVAGLQADAMYVCRAPQQTNTTERALEHPDH